MSEESQPAPAPAAAPRSEARRRVLVVTGLSGAGKSSALKALEDLGYEAVDNIPLSLVPSLVAPIQGDFSDPGLQRQLAVGADIRTRDFGVDSFLAAFDKLASEGDVEVKVVFMECDDDGLRRRYAETRHRHPLAVDRPVSDGIAMERRLLRDLRRKADVVIDTAGVGPGELKRMLAGHFGSIDDAGLSIFVNSFSFARGLPRSADLVFDVRFLTNPHYVPALRAQSGRDPAVGDYIRDDPGFQPFFDGLTALLAPLLPRYAAEGKSYLTVAFGCTGGRHRSVFIAERLAAWMRDSDQRVHIHHRDLPDGEPDH